MTTQQLAQSIGATHIHPCNTDRYYALFVPFTDKYGMKIYRIHYMVFADGNASLIDVEPRNFLGLPDGAIKLCAI